MPTSYSKAVKQFCKIIVLLGIYTAFLFHVQLLMAASINALYRQSEHTTQHRAGKKNDDSTTTIDYSLLLKHEDTRQRLCAALPFLVLQKIVPVAQPDLSYYSHLIRFSLITMHLQDDTFKRYRLLRTFRI